MTNLNTSIPFIISMAKQRNKNNYIYRSFSIQIKGIDGFLIDKFGY